MLQLKGKENHWFWEKQIFKYLINGLNGFQVGHSTSALVLATCMFCDVIETESKTWMVNDILVGIQHQFNDNIHLVYVMVIKRVSYQHSTRFEAKERETESCVIDLSMCGEIFLNEKYHISTVCDCNSICERHTHTFRHVYTGMGVFHFMRATCYPVGSICCGRSNAFVIQCVSFSIEQNEPISIEPCLLRWFVYEAGKDRSSIHVSL